MNDNNEHDCLVADYKSPANKAKNDLTERTTITACDLEVTETTLRYLNAFHFILNNENYRLVWASENAMELLTNEPVLRFILGNSSAEEQAAGKALWQDAYAKGGFLLHKTCYDMPIGLALLPVSKELHSVLTEGGKAKQDEQLTLVVGEAQLTPEDRAQRLQRFYGLTVTEAEIAVQLCCDGLPPKKCANLRNVSVDAVRGHIKSIYTKAKVNKMSQLTKLVLSV